MFQMKSQLGYGWMIEIFKLNLKVWNEQRILFALIKTTLKY